MMRRLAYTFTVTAALCAALVMACSGGGNKAAPHHPLAILGGDGLEWSVLRPLLLQGKMPNLKALMEMGIAGKLATFEPTLSPIIWTSIATGKPMEEHRILDFIDKSTGMPFTSNARRGKALWNIASDYDLETICVGWWVTWPAEEIHGYMVAPYSAAGQNNQNWKGNFNPTLENQTWPRDLLKEIIPIAEKYSNGGPGLTDAAQRLFPKVQGAKLNEQQTDLFGQALWSAAADSTYADIAIHLIEKTRASKSPVDLTMVYIGGTDVSSHRFWKYRSPAEFKFTVPPEEVALFDETIANYYLDFDAKVGCIVAALAPDTNVIVCSDHGFHATAIDKPDSPFSGHHMDAPPGVFIAAGPDFVKSPKSAAIADPKSTAEIPYVGKVMEVAPLAMYLLGIPLAQDFHLPPDGGLLINKTLVKEFVAKRPPDFTLYTHDDGFREATRPIGVSAAATQGIQQWMKQNGYIGNGASGATKENNPKPDKK